jgi:hypothetical protein
MKKNVMLTPLALNDSDRFGNGPFGNAEWRIVA